jgi:hypothetical protein
MVGGGEVMSGGGPWILGSLEVFGRREMEKGGGEAYGATVKWGKGKKNDLKIGHVKLQLECVRPHSC